MHESAPSSPTGEARTAARDALCAGGRCWGSFMGLASFRRFFFSRRLVYYRAFKSGLCIRLVQGFCQSRGRAASTRRSSSSSSVGV